MMKIAKGAATFSRSEQATMRRHRPVFDHLARASGLAGTHRAAAQSPAPAGYEHSARPDAVRCCALFARRGRSSPRKRWREPAERYEKLAHRAGFEPTTPRFVVWCSIQLSYRCGWGAQPMHHEVQRQATWPGISLNPPPRLRKLPRKPQASPLSPCEAVLRLHQTLRRKGVCGLDIRHQWAL